MNFFTYIVCWDDVRSNVLNIEKAFIENKYPHKVINSGSQIDENWMNVGDIRFYRQLYTAVKDFDESYEYMFWLAGDVSYNNWNNFLERANFITSSYNIWAYAPHLTNEPWGESNSKLINLNIDQNLLISVQTDGIAVILHRDVVNLLKKYFDYISEKIDITTITSGWGMDLIWCAYAMYNNKLIVRDNLHVLNHPAGSSYNHDKASEELKLVLNLFYDFCEENKIDSNIIKEFHNKIYARMGHDQNHMTIKSFYPNELNIIKNFKNINYHIIHINDIRKPNRDSVDEILNSNKVTIPSFDARVEGSVEKFQKDNPKFKISWDGFKIGEIGCFISHYIAWNYLLNSELDELLIFEDDVFIDETFVKKYQLAINNVPEDYDVLSIFVDSNQHDRFKESDKINYYISKGYQDWSTLCYIISKQGAEKLCKYVEEIGMDHPADWFIFRKGHAGIFNVYTLPPYIKNPVNIDKRYDSQVQ